MSNRLAHTLLGDIGATNARLSLLVNGAFGPVAGFEVARYPKFADAVAERAARNGIAFGSQSLSVEDMQNEERSSACAVDWCRNFHKWQGKVALELQTRKQSNPDRSGIIGSMVDLLPFALRMKTQIIEVYPEDWYVAYDPSSPDYEQHHEEYQKAYEAAARVLGGS